MQLRTLKGGSFFAANRDSLLLISCLAIPRSSGVTVNVPTLVVWVISMKSSAIAKPWGPLFAIHWCSSLIASDLLSPSQSLKRR